jgi:hypothetical protein
MAESATDPMFQIPRQAEYEHTQRSPMGWVILVPSLGILLAAALLTGKEDLVIPLTVAGTVVAVIAFSFCSLTVVDEGERLAVRFGPIPLFRKRIAYRDVVAVQTDRSTVFDGWGIHWVPGRGWTYNVWGFDCVRLELSGGKTIRIGSDDPLSLAQFIQSRIAQPA